MRYYINQGEQQRGPYTVEEIQHHLKDGTVRAEDYARLEGTSDLLPVKWACWPAGMPATDPKLPSLAPAACTIAGRETKAAARVISLARKEPPHSTLDQGNALTWPLKQRHWFKSAWMPLSWWMFPPFGYLLSLGWSVDAVGRLARKESQLLPRPTDLGLILTRGFVVMVMMFLYFWIPLLVLAKLLEWNWLIEVWAIALWLWQAFTGKPHDNLFLFLVRQAFRILSNAMIPAIYVAMAAPLFLAARIRYAITGKFGSFFNLFGNISLVFRHLDGILSYLFLALLTRAGLALILMLFASTVVATPVSLLLGGVGVWMLAYIAGNLAGRVCEELRNGQIGLVRQAP